MSLVQTIVSALSIKAIPLPYRPVLGYVKITQPQRNHRGITEEFPFRRPRDDLIGKGIAIKAVVRNQSKKGVKNGSKTKACMEVEGGMERYAMECDASRRNTAKSVGDVHTGL